MATRKAALEAQITAVDKTKGAWRSAARNSKIAAEQISENVEKLGKKTRRQTWLTYKGVTLTSRVVGAKQLALIGAATAGTIAIGNEARKAVALYTKYETDIANVHSLIADSTQVVKDNVESVIRQTAIRHGRVASDVAAAAYQAISAGVLPQHLEEFLRVSSKTALGGVTDVTTAVDLLTSALNAYSLSAENAAYVSDLMFTAVRLGKTTIPELARSIGQGLPALQSVGVTLEESLAMITSLTLQGLPTSEAVTQTRAVATELARESSKGNQLFTQLFGMTPAEYVEQRKEAGSKEPWLEMILEFARMTKGLGIAPQDVFSRIEAAQGLAGVSSSFRLDEIRESLQDPEGSTEEAAAEHLGTWAYMWSKLKAGWTDTLLHIGEFLVDKLKYMMALWNQHRDTILGYWEGFKTTVTTTWNAVLPIVKQGLSMLRSWFAAGFHSIAGTWQFFHALFRNDMAGLAEVVKEYGSKILNNYKDIIKGLQNLLMTIGKIVVEGVFRLMEHVLNALYNKVIDTLTSIVDKALKVVSVLDRIPGQSLLGKGVKFAGESLKTGLEAGKDPFKLGYITDPLAEWRRDLFSWGTPDTFSPERFRVQAGAAPERTQNVNLVGIPGGLGVDVNAINKMLEDIGLIAEESEKDTKIYIDDELARRAGEGGRAPGVC